MPTMLQPTRHPFEATTRSHAHGWTCQVRIPGGVSLHSPMLARLDGGLWFTGNVYGEDGYDACYFEMSGRGELLRVLKEDRGVLPEFLVGSNGELWAVIVDPYGARDRTIALPIDGREEAAEPKSMPADLGERVGPTTWVKRPLHSSGQDSVTTLAFKKGVPARNKPVKLPQPANHQLQEGPEGLLGIAWVDGCPVLRAFASDGSVARERELSLGAVRPVRLSFEGESWFVGTEGPAVQWITLSSDGRSTTRELFRLDEGEELYGIQVAAQVDRIALRFMTERGAGFALVRGGELVEAFRLNESGRAISMMGDDVITLGEGPLLLIGMTAWEGGYYLVTTPKVVRPAKPTELAVLGRVL